MGDGCQRRRYKRYIDLDEEDSELEIPRTTLTKRIGGHELEDGIHEDAQPAPVQLQAHDDHDEWHVDGYGSSSSSSHSYSQPSPVSSRSESEIDIFFDQENREGVGRSEYGDSDAGVFEMIMEEDQLHHLPGHDNEAGREESGEEGPRVPFEEEEDQLHHLPGHDNEAGQEESGEEGPRVPFEERDQHLHLPNGGDPVTSEGADLTKMDSLLGVLSFAVKHHISGVALQDLIKLINLHCPSSLPESKYLFGNSLSNYQGICEFHFYCKCMNYLGRRNECPPVCEHCRAEFKEEDNMKNGKFFIVLPLTHQLKHMLQSTEIGKKIISRNVNHARDQDVITDITDGDMYRELVTNGILSDVNNFSLTWNTDGVPIFKSSRSAIWPVLGMINELPMNLRRENVFLAALWFGDSKPEMSTFLKPFVEECNVLSTDGLRWQFGEEEKHSKVFPIICSVDSVARPLLQNMVQFNGFYGCSFCKHSGEYADRAMRYPHTDVPPEPRNDRQTKQESILAQESGRTITGIKGVSILSFLLHFNMISGFIPDYMHAVCLGVVKRFLHTWIDTANRHAEYYIGNKKNVIDNRIKSVKGTKEITRLPRFLNDCRFWKANEWRTYMYFSPALLKGILPVKYLAHWSMLVTAICILNSSHITRQSLRYSDFLLRKFVMYVEPLYGKQECTYNVHLLMHMADSVKNWGPLWGTSAFSFESFNGYIKTLFSGTRYLPQQIFQSICRTQDLVANLSHITSPAASEYVSKMMGGHNLVKNVQKIRNGFDEVICLGRSRLLKLSQLHKTALEEFLGEILIIENVDCFDRFVVKNVLFSTKLYSSKYRRIDSIVGAGELLGEILYLVSFKNHNCDNCQHNCRCTKHVLMFVERISVLRKLTYQQDPELGCVNNFISEVFRGDMFVMNCSDISKKCMVMKIDDTEYVVDLPNLIEGD